MKVMDRVGRIGRTLGIVILLSALPLATIDFAIRYLLRLGQENRRQERFQELDDHLVRLSKLSDPEIFLRGTLMQLARKAEKKADPLRWLLPMVRILEKRYPDLFTFLVFDRNDRLIPRDPPVLGRAVAEKILGILREKFSVDPWSEAIVQKIAQNKGMIQTYLGSVYKSVDLSGEGWERTSKKASKSWFFYHLSDGFALFAHVHRRGLRPMMGLKSWVAKPQTGRVSTFLVDYSSMKVDGGGGEREKSLAEKVAVRFENEAEDHFLEGGFQWSVMMLDDSFRLLAAERDDSQNDSEAWLTMFRRFAAIFLFLSFVMAICFLNPENLPYVSIRWKLLLLFLFSAGFPLAILAVTGGVYLQERRHAIIQETHRKLVANLRTLDSKLPTTLRMCKDRILKVLGRTNLEAPGGVDRLRKEISAFCRKNLARSSMMIDRRGRETMLHYESRTTFGSAGRIIKSFMLQVLKNVRGEVSVDAVDKGALENELLAETVAKDTNWRLLDDLTENMGKVFPIELGPAQWFFFADILRNSRGEAENILFVAWEKEDLIKLYLSHGIPLKPAEDGSEIFTVAFNFHEPVDRKRFRPGTRRMPPLRLSFRMHPPKRFPRDAWAFIRNSLRTRRLSFQTVNYKGGRAFLCDFPGNVLGNHCLFALKPLSPVLSELGTLRWQLFAFGLLSFGFTSALGLLLARKVLEPIKALGKGITAVREQDFRHRVPASDPDELGDLSLMFNRMLDGLHEMNLGRQIQEKLFPKKVLELNGYRVFGLSRTATDLGGDYFDYLSYGSDRLLVIIGDVTGHGVPASLVMAMSKATVNALTRLDHPPLAILENLNSVIEETMKKKLFITLAALWIDTRTHEAILFNCGHPFPFLRTPAGGMEMITSQGFPVGVRPKLNVKPVTRPLLPGEQLVFYTDGLAESLGSHQDEESGFDRLGKFIAGRPRLPVEESCQDILFNHPVVQLGTPLPDDFTVLCVERT